jgi:hypothetical protein
MHYCIAGILPTLVIIALRTASSVLEEAVTVSIA